MRFDDIKKQYDNLRDIMKNCNSVEEARSIANGFGINISICPEDGDIEDCYCHKFDDLKKENIEYFRVECWEDLAYIYFHKDGSIWFDVYEENNDDPTFESIDIESLKRNLDNETKFNFKLSKDTVDELISVLNYIYEQLGNDVSESGLGYTDTKIMDTNGNSFENWISDLWKQISSRS